MQYQRDSGLGPEKTDGTTSIHENNASRREASNFFTVLTASERTEFSPRPGQVIGVAVYNHLSDWTGTEN